MRSVIAACLNKLQILVGDRSGFFVGFAWLRSILDGALPMDVGHSTKSIGDYGEQLTANYLRQNGFKVLERSHRNRRGEIDLIAVEKKSRVLVFVEVKTWATDGPGGPSDAVDHRKQRRLTGAALEYLKSKQLLERPSRFDVVEVILGDTEPKIRHFKSAFEATGEFQFHS